jgi:deoxycytidylate deaminase
MGLTEFYKLRNNFILIGLTGRMRGGANEIGNLLIRNDSPFDHEIIEDEIKDIREKNINEGLKYHNLKQFINYPGNWKPFHIIKYRNVVLLHLLHACQSKDIDQFGTNILDFILGIGKPNGVFTKERFGSENQNIQYLQENLLPFLKTVDSKNCLELFDFTCSTLNDCLEGKEESSEIYNFFFGENFDRFSNYFFEILDRYSHILRIRLLHILAFYLRVYGSLNLTQIDDAEKNDLQFDKDLAKIYTVAKTIKFILKSCKYNEVDQRCNVVIDSLKNSFEINYFRERFAGFYLLSVNKDDNLRKKDVEKKIINFGLKENLKIETDSCLELDKIEYDINDFKNGGFASPDIENCIQKSDYHIYIDKEVDFNHKITDKQQDISIKVGIALKEKKVITKTAEENKNNYDYKSMHLQLMKLICLIKQPGIVTPSALERTMQVAYNAKLNSGCISRQVGAVVTDEFYSVKGIGWNDVPEGQTPCGLREIKDYESGVVGSSPIYTGFEKTGRYKDVTFIDKVKESINNVPKTYIKDENGRNCPYCFKSFHNAFEGKDNQVHTRSLHAEENAMLQITKYGGQSLKGGNLFTTASPCELCSKKAFQLGIKNIFFIDPYPGISKLQILKGGNSDKSNPNLYMYQGAIGRGYNKLYEPMMSIKDEITLRTGIKPKESDENKLKSIKILLENKFTDEKEIRSSLDELLKGKNGLDSLTEIIKLGVISKIEKNKN